LASIPLCQFVVSIQDTRTTDGNGTSQQNSGGSVNVGVLFSGGKDSVFSCVWALQQGWDVTCLMTIKSKNTHSWMFHTPNIHMVEMQAEALQIPLLEQSTKGEQETELDDLEDLFVKAQKKYDISGVIVGALFSDYQHERVNRVCHKLNLKTYAPLWHKNQVQLLSEMIEGGFDIIISSIAADGLSKKWLGRRLDLVALKELEFLQHKLGLHPAGEGGEYESLVLNGPFFKKKIVIEKATATMHGECEGNYVVEKARLE